ncbi:MAG: LysE family translocator [Chloroflexi bacterium]|nr:MAG: LysE family translocator [Chloroflexota bacterium]
MDSRLLAFLGVSLLLALTPGPDFALVTRNALAHGRRGVLLTSAGLTTALVVWVTVTALGAAAVLQTSAAVYSVLKLAGAAYLIYLGARTLWESRRDHGLRLDGVRPARPRALAIWRQGFLSALLNPKLGVFFVTFLPQFVNPGQPVLPRVLLLGGIFTVIGIAWMTLYGLSVSRLRAVVTAPRVRRWMERTTGTVLVGFGARLALDRV